jgi:hypothetical protein
VRGEDSPTARKSTDSRPTYDGKTPQSPRINSSSASAVLTHRISSAGVGGTRHDRISCLFSYAAGWLTSLVVCGGWGFKRAASAWERWRGGEVEMGWREGEYWGLVLCKHFETITVTIIGGRKQKKKKKTPLSYYTPPHPPFPIPTQPPGTLTTLLHPPKSKFTPSHPPQKRGKKRRLPTGYTHTRTCDAEISEQ